MEAFAADACDNFSGDAAPRKRFTESKQTTGASDGGEDGIGVHGLHGTEIDDFDLITIELEFFSGTQGFMHHGAVGDDGGVTTRARYACFADRQVTFAYLIGFEMVIEELVLAIDDGVVERDTIEQHPVGVFYGGGCNDDEAGIMRVDGLHRLAVKRTAARRATGGHADGDWAWHIRAPVECGGLIDDLIEADGGKVGELHFDDRPCAFHGGTDGHTDHGVLADGRIEDTTGEFFAEVLGGFEGTAESGDVLTIEEHRWIVAECLVLRLTNGFEVGDAHASCCPSTRSALERACQFSLKGSGVGSLDTLEKV